MKRTIIKIDEEKCNGCGLCVQGTGASSATISRVNRSLIYGNGGYESVLEKMKEKEGK